jgi:hypothetical protein
MVTILTSLNAPGVRSTNTLVQHNMTVIDMEDKSCQRKNNQIKKLLNANAKYVVPTTNAVR